VKTAETGRGGGADSRASKARSALAEAREWAATHPRHIADQIKFFQGILNRFDGTPAAAEARAEINELSLKKLRIDQAEKERRAREQEAAKAKEAEKAKEAPAHQVADAPAAGGAKASRPDEGPAKAGASEPEAGLSRRAYAALRAKSAEALRKRDFEAAAVPLKTALKEADGKPPADEIKAGLADLALAGQLMEQAEKNAPLMKGKSVLYEGKTRAEISGASGGRVYIKVGAAELPISLRNRALPAFEVVRFFDARPEMPKERAAQARVAFLLALEDVDRIAAAMGRLPSELKTRYEARLEVIKERRKAEALEKTAEKELARIRGAGRKPKRPEALLAAIAAFREKYKTTEVLAENRAVLKEIADAAQEATGRPPEDMVVVPAGEFLYGPEKEKCTLPAFKIDRHEVGNGEYALFVKWILGKKDLEQMARRIREVKHPEGSEDPAEYIPFYMPEFEDHVDLIREAFENFQRALKDGGLEEGERKELLGEYHAFKARHRISLYYMKKHAGHKEHWLAQREAFGGRELPVTHVGWFAAHAYAKWLGKRLPTAREWDKAARGTDGRSFPAGPWTGEIVSAYNGGNSYEFKDPYERIAPVNALARGASPYGCLNMSGNVWEWIAEPGECRGGSWRRCRMHLDLNCRDSETRPGTRVRDDHHGFRCVKDL
jgi:formylglycine-generating enzyme required for sulfatase activity